MLLSPQLLLSPRNAIGVSTVTWNSSDAGANITFGTGNLDAIKASATTGWTSVRATVSKSTGKRYFELTPKTAIDFHVFGVMNSVAGLADFIGNALGEAMGIDARNGTGIATAGSFASNASPNTGPGYVVGNVIGWSVDFDLGRLWVAKNNDYTLFGSLGLSDPATNTAPLGTFTPNLTLFPACSLYGGGAGDPTTTIAASGTGSFGPPTGFVWWNA